MYEYPAATLLGKAIKRLVRWAVRHSDKLPEKTLISLILRQKSSKSTKDFCGFFLISEKTSFFSGASQF
jgi:hypothetical protein